MSENNTKAAQSYPNHGIGSRQRKPDESTYGFPNHKDGIQSGNLTGGENPEPFQPEEEKTAPSGPGSRNGNGMAGTQDSSR